MNIYYMGENLNASEFPIRVWNTRVPRNVRAAQVPAGEYEGRPQRWGDYEKGSTGADAWASEVNNTDKDRQDTFPKLTNRENLRSKCYDRNLESES